MLWKAVESLLNFAGQLSLGIDRDDDGKMTLSSVNTNYGFTIFSYMVNMAIDITNYHNRIWF